ncbi:MAG TPA: beta-ketoacyl synthase N-terminal-like domain-containing protein [Bacillota bacterium]|nr:beta-ketoacyl synthase N-terminal-like domain-containing protein [Bacillota bacterium]
MKTVTKYIYNQVATNQLSPDDAKTMLKELQDLASNTEAGANSSELAKAVSSETAIIGIACRFPKANNPDEFWHNLINKINCIDIFPPGRCKEYRDFTAKSLMARMLSGNPREDESGAGAPGGAHAREGDSLYVKGGYLPEIDKFDAAFFRIPPREATHMDPVQRIFLEVAYEAMEDAGYGGQNLYGAKVGVFVGKDHTNPTMYKEVTEPDEMKLTGSWAGILASRLGYIYNFRGPAMVIDTACSSGLVAVHEACRALINKECEAAIAGGIQIQLFPSLKGGNNTMEMLESNDELVRTFDKAASGTVWGEGVGALILKPLDKAIIDHDHIYAVINGSAINNCGASSGITAPNVEAQKEVIIKAWKEAKIDPETISYIEAQSMGTSLGDPIEIKGITAAFDEFTTKKQFCGIGSVKTNLGHLVAASGLASVIKVVLALKNNEIPPLINFTSPNPYINFTDSPVYVNDYSRPWNSTNGFPRRAGISAFGFSGTNCHLILEEAPAVAHKEISPSPNQPGIFTISARNQHTLQVLLKRYQVFFEQTKESDLGNICFTANTGRGHYNFRIALLVTDMADLKQKTAQLIGMDLEKVREPGIYFGVYNIVPDHKVNHAENELTGSERKRLNTAANQKLNDYLAAKSDAYLSLEFMAELCRLYIKGADLAWNEFYKNQDFNKISLPPYPLERISVWAAPNTIEIEGLQIEDYTLKRVDGELKLIKTADNQGQPEKILEYNGLFKERQFPKALVTGMDNYDEEQTAYILAQIWARVLGLHEISADRSFYDMGGDSILASQLFKEIMAEYPGILSTDDLLTHSTVNELAKVIDQKGGAVKRKVPEVKPEGTSTDAIVQADPVQRKKPETFPDIYRVENLWPSAKIYQRDEPDAKELKLNLQREVTIALHRCLPLQVILSDERLHPWFYEHYVNIFSQIQGDGMLKLDYLEEWANYRHVMNEVSLGAPYMAEQKDIIRFIINNINQGNYLNVSVDEYFLPRKVRSERTHFIHHELVYGYDNQKRELKTIGFNEEKVIDILTFTYDEFQDAYEKGKEFYPESAPWASHTAVQLFYSNGFDRPYPFQIKFFLDRLDSYLRSAKEKEIVYYWSLKDERVEYGFKVHDVVLEYIEKLLQGILLMDYRALHLLYEHKNGLAKRFAYIIGRYEMTGRMIQLNEMYLNVVEQFKTIRLKFLDLENRFNYRLPEPEEVEYAKGQLEQMMAMIKSGKENEYAILTEIYEILAGSGVNKLKE